jgi:hypothetical protein
MYHWYAAADGPARLVVYFIHDKQTVSFINDEESMAYHRPAAAACSSSWYDTALPLQGR